MLLSTSRGSQRRTESSVCLFHGRLKGDDGYVLQAVTDSAFVGVPVNEGDGMPLDVSQLLWNNIYMLAKESGVKYHKAKSATVEAEDHLTSATYISSIHFKSVKGHPLTSDDHEYIGTIRRSVREAEDAINDYSKSQTNLKQELEKTIIDFCMLDYKCLITEEALSQLEEAERKDCIRVGNERRLSECRLSEALKMPTKRKATDENGNV